MNRIDGDVGAKFRQRRFGLRPLQRDQRAIGQRLDDAAIREMRAQMRLVLGLAGGVDHQEQMVAEIRDHQIVENAAVVIGELRVALPARRNRHDVLRHQPLQRAARRPRPCRISARSASWPICETSNRPAAARVCRCSFSTPAAYCTGMS